ncbi:MAG: hypothetical protein HC851_18760 [Acaryochloris sp. RU_4_1]|nr:hypothetical protein [Acaryochloris sp. RU_4_1]NJR57023.1 hypothetical protein [Acaryochloris sp. CRU_2_0]
MNLNRHQLMGTGLSAYQATQITKPCPPQGKSGRKNLYAASDVMQQIHIRLQQRIRKTTKAILVKALELLQDLTANVVSVPFGTDSSIMGAAKRLLRSVNNPQTEIHRLKVLEIAGKHAAR